MGNIIATEKPCSVVSVRIHQIYCKTQHYLPVLYNRLHFLMQYINCNCEYDDFYNIGSSKPQDKTVSYESQKSNSKAQTLMLRIR